MSYKNEPCLKFIESSPTQTIPIAYPKIMNAIDMVFIKTHADLKLTQNKFGIYEPDYDKVQIVQPDQKSLILLPSLAIDENGNRLGYGGGYYDRYLSRYPNGLRIGIVYDEFYLKMELPKEPTDIPLDAIITDKILHFF